MTEIKKVALVGFPCTIVATRAGEEKNKENKKEDKE